MAYDFIPKSSKEVENAKFSLEHIAVYDYFFKKFNRKEPIALSKTPSDKKNIKVSRNYNGVVSLPQLKTKLNLKEVKLSFGEGSRGGRGVNNVGNLFEVNLGKDLQSWWSGDKLASRFNEKVILEMAKQYKWDKAKTFKVEVVGGLNQKRPLIFNGKNVFIGTTGDQNIGSTVTDITVTADGKPVYLSLKATGTVTFFNAGVATIFREKDLKTGNVTDPKALALLRVLGLNSRRVAAVFNSYGGDLKRYEENVTSKIDRPRLIKMLLSGIGYGFHYVHAKKPTEIHHFNMTKQFMNKLANPSKAIAYYGGMKSGGKRIDIVVDTPYITLKFNIRNKQGGVYPSHIMCDYSFKRYK
jgi:hypothetical protein|tara:strand:+ start:290 stop:1354 length:1065 start_codon:yes stop_codon:yes gene_type:complete